MGWSTDWLYELLLNRARDTLAEVKAAAFIRSEAAPLKLLASEHAGFHYESNMTRGLPTRVWSSEDDFTSLLEINQWPPENDLRASSTQSIYRVPTVSWAIARDRKQVLICRWIGPRYASGVWWEVLGQGTTGRLSKADRECWIS